MQHLGTGTGSGVGKPNMTLRFQVGVSGMRQGAEIGESVQQFAGKGP